MTYKLEQWFPSFFVRHTPRAQSVVPFHQHNLLCSKYAHLNEFQTEYYASDHINVCKIVDVTISLYHLFVNFSLVWLVAFIQQPHGVTKDVPTIYLLL